jgi:hypothetical protein
LNYHYNKQFSNWDNEFINNLYNWNNVYYKQFNNGQNRYSTIVLVQLRKQQAVTKRTIPLNRAVQQRTEPLFNYSITWTTNSTSSSTTDIPLQQALQQLKLRGWQEVKKTKKLPLQQANQQLKLRVQQAVQQRTEPLFNFSITWTTTPTRRKIVVQEDYWCANFNRIKLIH